MATTLRPLSHAVVGFVLAALSASSGPLVLRHAHSGAHVTGIPVTLPLSFEANRGQVDGQVRYLARGPGYTVFLTDREAVLTLKARAADRGPLASEPGRERPRLSSGAVLRIQPAGAGRHAAVQPLDQLPGVSNYFIGNDPARWRTGIPTYGKVKYDGIYPGVDLVYYGNQRQLEFDFIVAPGADPSTIGLAFQGIDDLEVGPQGDLVLKVKGGEVRMHKPSVYQAVEGQRQTIPGEYVVKGKNQVGFMVAAYDTGKPLVIDPTLSYSTYLGGASADVGNSIFVDGAGNAYVTGSTQSSGAAPAGFPTTVDAFQTTFGGTTDAFVTKLSADGKTLVYSTYLGGADDDVGNSIVVDGAGNAYVTGSTKSSGAAPAGFPTTMDAYQTVYGGSGDAFVTKLNPGALGVNDLVYSTYLGGASDDMGNSIFVDGAGNAYVTGSTQSSGAAPAGFPTTAAAFQTTFGGTTDAFVTKLNGTGTALVYSSYLGGASDDMGNSIFVDGAGNAYVTGSTQSSGAAPAGFPTTVDAFQTIFGGTTDAFVAKIGPSGSSGPGTSVSDSGGGGGCFIATASAFEPRK